MSNLDQTIASIKDDLAKLVAGQELLLKKMDGQHAWFKFLVNDMRLEEGQTTEDLVALALRYGLKVDDITPDTLCLGQPIQDPESLVFHPGYQSDIDLIVGDGTVTLFEVKFGYIKNGDPGSFGQIIKLFQLQNPDLEVKGLLISPGADDEILEQCQIANIRLLR